MNQIKMLSMDSYDASQTYLPSILIVDDNPHNLQVLGKLLQENKYEIEFATNGEAALDWLNTRQFDIILLDINMPGMNGFEVCMKIRLKPDLMNVPVIFLSAESDRENILKGFELGAQDYITKPFDSRELLVRVKTHLTLKNNREKLEKLNRLLEEKVAERTEQLKAANEKLEATNLKLLDLDRAKADFLTLISHQIRTPLNGIIGPVELLKESADAHKITDLIEILDMSVKRLERFSLNALLITRLKTKQLEIAKDKFQISDLINEVLNERRDNYQSKNIKVAIKNVINDRLISGEMTLVKKCFENIFENAILFTPQGGTIEIAINTEGQYVICEIKDSGKGFEESVIDNLFELFKTADVNKDNSTGTGIPIAKMIMEAHGGKITVGNVPGSGASVRLLFQSN